MPRTMERVKQSRTRNARGYCRNLKAVKPHDIVCAIMSPKSGRLREEIENIRRTGTAKGKDLISLGLKIGRTIENRGKHTMLVMPNRRPIPIPSHGAKDLNKFTVKAILNEFEADLDFKEESLYE